jgi:hypothetical protein
MVGEQTGAAGSVDWLARDQDFTEGMDHLGIQVVSTNIYARLLPGISNLTDRARYFAFYPWVLDSFARLSPGKGADDWWRWIRRHEFTFSAASIAAEVAGKIEDEAAGGVIGARAARSMVNKKGAKKINIDAATRIENGKAAKDTYFKNREGGYGQYYKNQMTVLGLMRHDEDRKAPDRQLTRYAGEKVSTVIEGTKAFRELRELAATGETVAISDLAAIGQAVHPGVIDPDSTEADHLRRILLGTDDNLCQGQTAEERIRRRQTLALVLGYLEKLDPETDDVVAEFRWGALEQSLVDGSRWKTPAHLESTRLGWAAYVQNELLNYALECLMWSVVKIIDAMPMTPRACAELLAQAAVGAKHAPSKLAARVDAAVAAFASVPKETWGEGSTFALFDALNQTDAPLPCAAAAFRLLLRVAADRARYGTHHPFASIHDGDEIARRDVHLRTWWERIDEGATESTEAFVAQLVIDWVIFRHLRVATRKLASQGDYTYRFRPEEGLLVSCGEVDPTFTNPRLRQGMRMLADIGLIRQDFGKVSSHGRKVLAMTT